MTQLGTLQARLWRLWWNHGEAGANAWMTIALRLPLLASQDPTRPSAEARRMVREKIAALAEGSLAAGLHASRTVGRSPPDVIGIVDALARPARKRVRANAKRLATKRVRK
jgi:hypothetical protein